jgi:hypothetical protein
MAHLLDKKGQHKVLARINSHLVVVAPYSCDSSLLGIHFDQLRKCNAGQVLFFCHDTFLSVSLKGETQSKVAQLKNTTTD